MKIIEVSEMGKLIENTPKCINILFLGSTGIGKTTVVEKWCKENDYFLKTLILSQIEASESLGIPIKTEKEFQGKLYPVLETAVPLWVFELAENSRSVLFLDELLCAEPSVMNAFLNFLSQKQVNGIDLQHVKIVAASNIGRYTYDLDENMVNRFCFFYVRNTNYQEYLNDVRLANVYIDDFQLDGPLFEPRQLTPRCQEQLMHVSNEYFSMFYEGFTNKEYFRYHTNEEINIIISPFIENGVLSLTNMRTAVELLRDRDIDELINGMLVIFNKGAMRRMFAKKFKEYHKNNKINNLLQEYVENDRIKDEDIPEIVKKITSGMPKAITFNNTISRFSSDLIYNEEILLREFNDHTIERRYK